MLIGIFTVILLMFGGGGLDFYLTDIKKPAKAAIEDKARLDVVLDTSKSLNKELKKLQKAANQQLDDYVKAHRDYHATEEDFDRITVRFMENQKAFSKLVLDARDAMHEQMTAEEWAVVFAER